MIKNITLLTGLGLSSVGCSEENNLSSNRDTGRLEATLWSDFNKNGVYNKGEDTAPIKEDPIYFANKSVRVRYVGPPNETNVDFYVVTDWPHLVVNKYSSSSKDGVHRLEDSGEFIKNLNAQVKLAGNYVLVASPQDKDYIVFQNINSAQVPSLEDEMQLQMRQQQPNLELWAEIQDLKEEIRRLKR